MSAEERSLKVWTKRLRVSFSVDTQLDPGDIQEAIASFFDVPGAPLCEGSVEVVEVGAPYREQRECEHCGAHIPNAREDGRALHFCGDDCAYADGRCPGCGSSKPHEASPDCEGPV